VHAQLERQRSDARANVEQPSVQWADLREASDEETRRRFRALGAVSGEFLRCLFRAELPLDRVADAGTATTHRLLPPIMRIATTTPDAKVRNPTAVMAAPTPSQSASTPDKTAPTA